MQILLVKITCLKYLCRIFLINLQFAVYLYTTPETAFKRIMERDRSEEKKISLNYLQNLHDLHEKFIRSGLVKRFCKAPVSDS